MNNRRAKVEKNDSAGFTLLELLLAATISIILFIAILRLYVSSVTTFNLQDIITEMNQNANYTCRRLSEEIMQAGTNLPESGYPIIEMDADHTDSISICSNPTGAKQQFFLDVDSTQNIEVASGEGFRGITEVVKLSSDGVISIFQINSAFNNAPFVEGVNTESTPHVIRSLTMVAFKLGDKIFASNKRIFFKDSCNFCLGSSTGVLAENIDSLSVVFFDKSNTATIVWDQMMYAEIYVRSRASVPDPKYTHPSYGDHYRRAIQTMNVLIRKKATF